MIDDVDTKDFSQYFLNFYFNNYEEQAYCFRKNCGINTNMRLESMHKVIKYFYLGGKRVMAKDQIKVYTLLLSMLGIKLQIDL